MEGMNDEALHMVIHYLRIICSNRKAIWFNKSLELSQVGRGHARPLTRLPSPLHQWGFILSLHPPLHQLDHVYQVTNINPCIQ
uniref:Uncharacterized protein n=1 Tax=Picea glauca TaxID=3330 RepID=A0A101M2A9_PICGL|nr:hypothetical protein ABT39_MTgene2827 [Picea glauca]QHR87640.1 hypothetical protein Q903MT_gene1652 [Picea sitchensis]